MNDNEAVLGKVKELFDNTLKELIEIKDTLIVLRSSENNIAESYTSLGADAIDMIMHPLSLCIQKFTRFTKKPLDVLEISQCAKEIDSIFYGAHYKPIVAILELYIIYTLTDVGRTTLAMGEESDIEDLEISKCNGAITRKLYDRIRDIFNETGRRFEDLLPSELKVEAA